MIAGAFRTTPCEPLHQLLSILPIDLRLSMLTQNTALRLYRVSKDSQLLKCLGTEWLNEQPPDPSRRTPDNGRAQTTLCRLTVIV